jgi:hypothetical protein
MSGNRNWRNWLARLIDISGPLALAAGALVLGMRVEREAAPAWEGWVLALPLGLSQWRWRTLSPKDAAVAASKRYRIYARVTAAGQNTDASVPIVHNPLWSRLLAFPLVGVRMGHVGEATGTGAQRN